MSVLVTGATGQLGQCVVSHLGSLHGDVRILTRRPFLARSVFGDSVDIREWHPFSEDVPGAAIDGIDAVIHLMGEPLAGRATPARLAAMTASRLVSTEALVNAIGQRAVRLVSASVATSLGRTDDVITEGSRRSAPATPFEANVLAWETAAQSARAGAASVVIVRLGLLIGDTPYWRGIARLAALGFAPDIKRSRIPAIDMTDAAALIVGLLGRPDIEGPVIGVAPRALSGADLASILNLRRRTPWRLPAPRGFTARRLGPLAALLYNQTHIVPRRLMEAGATFAHPDPLQSLARVLGAPDWAMDPERAKLADISAH
jgi:NAD dependent epimerase/dehydratase family enzyme